MVTLDVNIDGLERRFETLAEFPHQLERALRRFGAYLRKRAIERYKAQDFAPLAPSTLEKRAQKGLRAVERKLQRDVRKASLRAQPTAPRSLLARILGSPEAAIDATAVSTRGARNRLAVLAEFQRRHRRSGELAARGDLKALSLKQLVSLGGREDRAVAKAVGRPILGSLPNSLVVEAQGSQVTLASRTHRKWTDVHNQGGTAGHDARVPKRETIRVDSTDLDVLVEILKDEMLIGFEGAA